MVLDPSGGRSSTPFVAVLALGLILSVPTMLAAETHGPTVTVRPAIDGCAPAAFVAELRALGLDVRLADRDEGGTRGAGVALQRGADGIRLVLWLEPSEPPERLAVGSATCDDAALMAALIVNRRLRAGAEGADAAPGLSLRPLVPAERAPLAVERAAAPPTSVPPPVATAWALRVDVLSGVELAFDERSPDAAGLEARVVVSPGDDRLLLSAALGFNGSFAWPTSSAQVTGYAVDAFARGGARFRPAWLDLEPTLGVGLTHHLVRLDDDGGGFVGRSLPRVELALGLGVAHPVSARLDVGLLWAPWTLTVVAPSRGFEAILGGVTARVRLGFGIDFL